jgi:hypothetical protein
MSEQNKDITQSIIARAGLIDQINHAFRRGTAMGITGLIMSESLGDVKLLAGMAPKGIIEINNGQTNLTEVKSRIIKYTNSEGNVFARIIQQGPIYDNRPIHLNPSEEELEKMCEASNTLRLDTQAALVIESTAFSYPETVKLEDEARTSPINFTLPVDIVRLDLSDFDIDFTIETPDSDPEQ